MDDLEARLREALLRLQELAAKLANMEAAQGQISQALNLVRQNPAT